MELFAQAAGSNRELLEVQQITNSNVRAWVTRDEAGFSYVLFINKDLNESGQAKVLLPGRIEEATAIRLTSPSANATSGISLAGLTWDGVTGPIPISSGTPAQEIISPDAAGSYQLQLPAASAALVTIPPADASNLVIARPIAPTAAVTGQTILLEGGNSFGDNLSYQWEQLLSLIHI